MPSSPTGLPTGLTVDRADVTLAVRDHGGSGVPLLLVHGATRTLADWSEIAGELVADHRVFSMDLRAHGRSGRGAEPWTIAAALGDIEAVLDACGVPEAVLVGHSLGGMLAALYADAHPRTPGAVNLDGFGLGRPEQYAGLDPRTVAEGLDRARQFARAAAGRVFPPEGLESVRAQAAAMAAGLGFAPELLEEGMRRSLGETGDGQFFLRPERERAVEMLEAMDELDMFPVYRRLTRPMLIVRGTRLVDQGPELAWFDELMAAYMKGLEAGLGKLAAEHPRISVRTVDASHAMLLERPRALAELVRSFTTGLDLCS
ncbi:alpha/beta hydrolase [Streptomyces sp. NPDC019937]|uniref:alpha/beta fold hydrolase n=1 Tax=Streptomyces sp. NPDC019937 TaxID=3154787 RepID=UPI0033DF4B55